jgi:hypothetical protein
MSATPFADLSALEKRRRRGIFVETGRKNSTSSVGAAYADVAPTELNDFAVIFLQRCRACGVGLYFRKILHDFINRHPFKLTLFACAPAPAPAAPPGLASVPKT